VVHFPIQAAFVTDVPSIYHPHDLQHLHFSQFFSAEEYQLRENLYRGFSAQARYVAVTSSWVRDDLIRQYHLDPSKVVVVSWPSILTAYRSPSAEELSAIQSRFALPDRFLLYPAQTWSHKNHLRLLEAIARVRDERNVTVTLVCCGHLTDFYHSRIVPMIRELRLEQQVRFLGFVSSDVLRGLYALCHGVIVPTTFEAASGPVSEAMSLGLPIACSNVTALPAQVGDGALLFGPEDVEGIMNAAMSLWTDEALCADLGRRARAIAEQLSWPITARTFRALYRTLAGRPLTEEDRMLLAAPPTM
jgi:glycosyltransferase involved in cell wall biosynthesis